MSERMIELQRARMGLPIKTAQSAPHPNSASNKNKLGGSSSSSSSAVPHKSTTIPKVYAQDEKICLFLQKLQHTKPTVPPSLSRRILNKQGVGYTDPLVSTIVSSAADRFLATVLSQALVCRDRRLKGEELARKNRREMDRVKKRRRAERHRVHQKRQRLEKELKEFATAKGPSSSSHKKDSRKLSPELAEIVEKGGLDAHFQTDDIHDEEEYYDDAMDHDGHNNHHDNNHDNINSNEEEKKEKETNGNESYEEDESDIDDSDDEDDDRDILQMRDLARPLEAWGMSLTGKIMAAEQSTRSVPKKKAETENDEDNLVVLEGEDAVEEDEDDMAAAAVAAPETEKTPKRKKAATPKPTSPKPPSGGRNSPVPTGGNGGKSDDVSSTQGKK